MISEFVASLRHRLRHSRIDPSRVRYREKLRLDTRRDLEFRSYTRIFAWNPGLHRRCRNDPLAGVATLGIGVLQQRGNISGRRVAFTP